MTNWDMFKLNEPDPHEAVQRYHGHKRAPLTLERALLGLAIVAGISLLPLIALFVIAARAN